MAFTVNDLREILNDALSELEDYDGDETIRTRCNTYGMYGRILEVPGGFIALDDLKIEGHEEDDDEEE